MSPFPFYRIGQVGSSFDVSQVEFGLITTVFGQICVCQDYAEKYLTSYYSYSPGIRSEVTQVQFLTA